MVLFKQKHIDLILSGRKTQTRRIHKRPLKIGKTYGIRRTWFEKSIAKITILRAFRQRLGDISIEDIQKEGYNNIWEFRKEWEEIHGPGNWNPDQVVMAYEFRLLTSAKTGKPSPGEESQQL